MLSDEVARRESLAVTRVQKAPLDPRMRLDPWERFVSMVRPPNSSKTMGGVRRSADNSRKKVQIARADSSVRKQIGVSFNLDSSLRWGINVRQSADSVFWGAASAGPAASTITAVAKINSVIFQR